MASTVPGLASSKAIDLPQSIEEPPPMGTTTASSPSALSFAAPASTLRSVGLGSTPSNTSTFKLAALSASITASSTPLAARFLSVTMSADVLPSA